MKTIRPSGGLVQQRGMRRGTRKAHVTYALSAEAESIFPKAYGLLLNHLVTVISKRLPSRALRATMRNVGRALAEGHLERLKGRSRRDRIKAAIDALNELGGSAKFEENEDKQFIYGRNGCPLAAVTASHPEACLIVQSLVSKVVGVRKKNAESMERRHGAVLNWAVNKTNTTAIQC